MLVLEGSDRLGAHFNQLIENETKESLAEMVCELTAELLAAKSKATQDREFTESEFDGEVRAGEGLYAAYLKLQDERDELRRRLAELADYE